MGIQIYNIEKPAESSSRHAGDQTYTGFPSPAEDYLENGLDLHKMLIKKPSATFFGRVKGSAMKDAGIGNGDLLVIDKSEQCRQGALAVCFADGAFTLKKIKITAGQTLLLPANQDDAPGAVTADPDLQIWGIVTYIIKKVD